jgi:hypothetical protein
MSVSFYPYIRTEQNGETVWTFPEGVDKRFHPENLPAYDTPEYDAWLNGELDLPNPHYDARLDLNMSERNAAFVLNELGLHTADLMEKPDPTLKAFGVLTTGRDALYNSDPMPIDAFESGLRATIARNSEPIFGLPGCDLPAGPGPRVIDPGVADGYANRRLNDLLRLVEAAREYGATHIGWG